MAWAPYQIQAEMGCFWQLGAAVRGKARLFSSFVFLSPDSVTRRGLIPPKWLIFGSIKILAKKGQKSNFNLDLGIIYAVMSKLC